MSHNFGINKQDPTWWHLSRPRNEYEMTLAQDRVLKLSTAGRVNDHDLTKSRAWCLQEEWLSRQLLKFTQDKIEHRFTQGISYPDRPLSNGQPEKDFCWIVQQSNTLTAADKDYVRIGAHQFAKQWQNILTDYTRRRLTRSTDKLPAISGIARYVLAQNPEDRYLAGNFLKSSPTIPLVAN
jgi:hypothetical protein